MDSARAAGDVPVPAGYSLIRELGHGRAGPTLLCRTADGREVVVRVFLLDPADAPAAESELRALAAAADHPCAVRTFRVWRDDAVGLCAEQEYCAGGSLAGRMPVSPAEATVGAARLAAALGTLHRSGTLHGDVAPANVLLDAAGEWKLVDAGLTSALGIAAVAADQPRELRGWEQPGPAADVFGLGSTVHAALTGTPVTSGSSGPSLTVTTPTALAGLLGRMLADDPADRPTLAEIDQVLRSAAGEADRDRLPPPVAALPAPALPRPKVTGLDELPAEAPTRRRGVLIAAGAAVLFFAGAGAVIATEDRPADGGAQLSSAPLSPGSVATGDSPAPAAPQPTVAPRVPTPAPVRGTSPDASGALVDQGLVPYRIAVFVYQGRLGVLLHMQRISTNLKKLLVYSVRPDGSDRRPGDDSFSDRTASAEPRSIGFFFERNVSTRRCVQIDVVLREGQKFRDSRIVCARPLADSDRFLAEESWKAYRQLENSPAAPQPSPRPTPTPGRQT